MGNSNKPPSGAEIAGDVAGAALGGFFGGAGGPAAATGGLLGGLTDTLTGITNNISGLGNPEAFAAQELASRSNTVLNAGPNAIATLDAAFKNPSGRSGGILGGLLDAGSDFVAETLGQVPGTGPLGAVIHGTDALFDNLFEDNDVSDGSKSVVSNVLNGQASQLTYMQQLKALIELYEVKIGKTPPEFRPQAQQQLEWLMDKATILQANNMLEPINWDSVTGALKYLGEGKQLPVPKYLIPYNDNVHEVFPTVNNDMGIAAFNFANKVNQDYGDMSAEQMGIMEDLYMKYNNKLDLTGKPVRLEFTPRQDLLGNPIPVPRYMQEGLNMMNPPPGTASQLQYIDMPY